MMIAPIFDDCRVIIISVIDLFLYDHGSGVLLDLIKPVLEHSLLLYQILCHLFHALY